MRISILGCGWLGLRLGQFLAEKGYVVNGSTTSLEKFPVLQDAGIQPFLVQVTADGVVGNRVEAFFQSEVLVINFPPGRRRPTVEQEHPKEIQRVLENAQAGYIQHILFVSSTGVYGDENRILTEADALNPDRGSTKALAEAEQLLHQLPNISVTILRMAGLVGGERKAGRFLAGKQALPHGDAPVNMVHREDCIRIMYEVIRQEKWGEIFNVCADEHPTKREFYTAQALKEGLQPPTFVEEGALFYKIISNTKLKQTLDYQFLYPNPMEF